MSHNNDAFYDAVLSSVCGASVSAWITSTVPSDYASYESVAIAVATEVDSLLSPIIPGPSLAQVELLSSICAGTFRERIGTSTSPNTYSQIAQSIVAMYIKLAATLTNVPNIYGGITPLGKYLYVDPTTTTPLALQNGSAGAPFSAISTAIASASANTALILQPADYTSEGTLNIPPIGVLTFLNLSPGLYNATLGPVNAPGVTLSFYGTQVVGNLSCQDLWMQFASGVYGDVTVAQSVNSSDQSYINGVVTAAYLTALNSDVYGGGSISSFIYAVNSGMPDSLDVNGYVELNGCRWDPGGGTWTFTGAPGQIILDAYSNWSWKTTLQSLVNGTKVIAGDLVP